MGSSLDTVSDEIWPTAESHDMMANSSEILTLKMVLLVVGTVTTNGQDLLYGPH